MKIPTLLIASFALSLPSAFAQENGAPFQSDPYKKADTQAVKDSRPDGDSRVSICYEDFSLPLAMAAALQQEKLSDAELYAKVRSALGTDAVRQETFVVVRTQTGQIAKAESVTEMIYPTEYLPPASSAPAKVSSAPPTQTPEHISRTSATPTAFDTRNVGFTLQTSTNLSNGDELDIVMDAEHVTLVGQSTAGQESSKTEMPIFETQRVKTNVKLTLNVPFLLGTMNLPVNSKQDPVSAKRIWFSFLTGTLSK